MRPRRHQLAAEQQDAQERRFQEEGGQRLIGEQRAQHIACRVRVAAPVGADLEGHDHAGHHADAKRHREDADPVHGDPQVDAAARHQVQSFQDRDVGGHADGEGGQQDMPADHPGEL